MRFFPPNRLLRHVLPLLALIAAVPLSAEVVESSFLGFTTVHALDIQAERSNVFAALTQQVGSWWDPAHTYSGDPANMSLDLRPGGCLCEELGGNEGFVVYMGVALRYRDELLRLRGAMGPLQGLGVAGAMTFQLEAAGSGLTRLTCVYQVGGHGGGDLSPLASEMDAYLNDLLSRLRDHVAQDPGANAGGGGGVSGPNP